MEYKFNEIEKKWQDNWKNNNTYKVSNNSESPNIMCWICFLTQVVQGCMWGIRLVILPAIFTAATKD